MRSNNCFPPFSSFPSEFFPISFFFLFPFSSLMGSERRGGGLAKKVSFPFLSSLLQRRGGGGQGNIPGSPPLVFFCCFKSFLFPHCAVHKSVAGERKNTSCGNYHCTTKFPLVQCISVFCMYCKVTGAGNIACCLVSFS